MVTLTLFGVYVSRTQALVVVVYDGMRYSRFDETCSCDYFEYAHGAPDLAGNHADVVMQALFFTTSL